ncbi:MAG TPA: Sec-independent protein translocase protein TatB [Thermoanaerobaculaceae bacterium]|nr:Sec-independent protein translocase protein TatB [Thermoanaerobaculaceae bacterium]
MFGSIGLPELLLIFVIALLLFGPRKLPDIGKSLGKAMGEFRRASNDLQRSLEEEVAADELRAAKREVQEAVKPIPPGETPASAPATPTEQPPTAEGTRPPDVEPK